MIVSYDTITFFVKFDIYYMSHRPPYTITNNILHLVAQISEQLGSIKTIHLHKTPAQLRKQNRIRTIQSSLQIEGNTLSLEQVTSLMENKRVIGPPKDILEVKNAIRVYEKMNTFDPYSYASLCKAHQILMTGLVDRAGEFRTKAVGIAKGKSVTHIAPPGNVVKSLVKDLFQYLKKDNELLIIKSCVFHYEFEFIHPFMDGNGRLGRFWQTLLLKEYSPIFEFLPIETLIKSKQKAYYKALSNSDKSGNSTEFIEFMLGIINSALDQVLLGQNKTITTSERILYFKEHIGSIQFTRKNYLMYHKTISMATASRDLKEAVESGVLTKKGDKRVAVYSFSKKQK